MGSVRTFTSEDAGSVSELNNKVFIDEATPPPHFFVDAFLNNPWFDPHIPPLVHAEEDGRITGFLGVVPRDIEFGAVQGRAAIVCQFMVAVERRSSMAALKLLKQHFAGSQLISIADAANESGRSIWTALGAEMFPIYSFTWNRSLRSTPTNRLLTRIGRLPGLNRVSSALTPLADKTDNLFNKDFYPWRRPLPLTDMPVRDVTASEIVVRDEKFSGRLMTFNYNVDSLAWLFEHAEPTYGVDTGLCAKGVYDKSENMIGLFVYFIDEARNARVLHFTSTAGRFSEVFNALIRNAWQDGAGSVGGRMNPDLNISISGVRDLRFTRRQLWTVVHSKEPSLLSAIRQGTLVMSQLECEWGSNFRAEVRA